MHPGLRPAHSAANAFAERVVHRSERSIRGNPLSGHLDYEAARLVCLQVFYKRDIHITQTNTATEAVAVVAGCYMAGDPALAPDRLSAMEQRQGIAKAGTGPDAWKRPFPSGGAVLRGR